MSSGNRSVLIALLERADPDDILKLQALEAQRSGEIARWLVAAKIKGSFHAFPGMIEAYNAVDEAAAPSDEVAHQCLSGLLVRPDAGTYLKVDPGGAAFYQPARAGLTVDDTPWIFGFSGGQDEPTLLTFVANAGPGIRWDIVECQAGPDVVESEAIRELFDPVANAFNPATVDKIQASAFTFRIRPGVQGAGIPPIDPDWMPLAAVHVRADATGFGNCDLYDIRPLTTERVEWSMRHPLGAPSAGTKYRSVLEEASFQGAITGAVNGQYLKGYYRGHFGGYWSGGSIRRNLPAASLADFGATSATSSNFNGVNLEHSAQRSGAFALAANSVITLGAFFPRGYPRWVRYSQAPLVSNTTTRLRVGGVRLPEGCRGILVVVNDPAGATGQVKRNGTIEAVAMPAVLGETANAFGHVVNYAAVGIAGNNVFVGQGGSVEQKYHWTTQAIDYAGAFTPGPTFSDLAILPAAAVTVDGLATPKAAATAFANIINNIGPVPCNAAGLLCEIRFSIIVHTASHLTDFRVAAEANGFGMVLDQGSESFRNDSGGDITVAFRKRVWVPLTPQDEFDHQAVQFTHLAWELTGNAGALETMTSAAVRVLGYSF